MPVPKTTARNGPGGVIDARTPGVTRTPGTVKKTLRGSGGGWRASNGPVEISLGIKARRLKHHFSAQTRPHLGPRVSPCIRDCLFRFCSRIMDGNVEPYRPHPVGFLFDRPNLHRSHGANLKPTAKNCYDQRARIPNAQLSGDCNKPDSGRLGFLPTEYAQ